MTNAVDHSVAHGQDGIVFIEAGVKINSGATVSCDKVLDHKYKIRVYPRPHYNPGYILA